MNNFFRKILSIFIGVVLAWLTAIPLIPYTYALRGYRAIGGEWVLIFGAGIFGYLVFHALFRRRG